MLINEAFDRVKKTIERNALTSLGDAGDKTEFTFGQKVGFHQGLTTALTIIDGVLKEND